MVGGQARHVASYMKDFLFAPEQIRTPVRVLSGGERGRLMLARALAKPSNVLVLDEPTNDLDLETLDVLEDMLGDYAGTIILISHDRDFLDRVVNAVIVPEINGHWAEYAGGYSDMLAQRGDDLVSKVLTRKAEAKAKGEKTSAAPREQKQSKRRMTFNDKHALDTLPRQDGSAAKRHRKTAEAARRSGPLCARLQKNSAEISAALRRSTNGTRRVGRTLARTRNAARRNRAGVTRDPQR